MMFLPAAGSLGIIFSSLIGVSSSSVACTFSGCSSNWQYMEGPVSSRATACNVILGYDI